MNSNRSEQGAVATIVAILFGLGVVFATMALAIDVGGLMVERRQLQNGADATAMSLAQSCANGNCVVGADGLETLADANALDGDHAIASQCGANVGGLLPACPASSLATTNCPPLPPAYATATTLPYVEVRTSTRSNGAGSMVNIFSGAAGNDPDTTVLACSRAGWGQPGAGSATTPITISICEWNTYTSSGSTWVVTGPQGAWPGYGGSGQPAYPPAATTPTNTPGHELIITLHDPSKPPCSFNGKDTAGGFGYLDPTDECSSTVTITPGGDQWANIDTGSSATGDCQTLMAQLYDSGPTIDIPVFDCIVRSVSGVPTGGIDGKDCSGAGAGGAQSYYHIVGWAKFYLSGYKIGGGPATERASRVSGVVPCSGAVRCMSGWFVKGTLAGASTIVPPTTGIDLGSYAVVPLG